MQGKKKAITTTTPPPPLPSLLLLPLSLTCSMETSPRTWPLLLGRLPTEPSPMVDPSLLLPPPPSSSSSSLLLPALSRYYNIPSYSLFIPSLTPSLTPSVILSHTLQRFSHAGSAFFGGSPKHPPVFRCPKSINARPLPYTQQTTPQKNIHPASTVKSTTTTNHQTSTFRKDSQAGTVAAMSPLLTRPTPITITTNDTSNQHQSNHRQSNRHQSNPDYEMDGGGDSSGLSDWEDFSRKMPTGSAVTLIVPLNDINPPIQRIISQSNPLQLSPYTNVYPCSTPSIPCRARRLSFSFPSKTCTMKGCYPPQSTSCGG